MSTDTITEKIQQKPKMTIEEYVAEQGNLDAMKKMGLFKSKDGNGRGSVAQDGRKLGSNSIKGMITPDEKYFGYGITSSGIRERDGRMNFNALREVSSKVSVIAAIQQTRIQQIRPFSYPSFNEEDEGYMIKLRSKRKTPTKKQEKEMDKIAKFLFNTGFKDHDGAEDREDRLPALMEKMIRDELTIDQIVVQPEKNNKGELIAFWGMDGAYIKRISDKRGYNGNKKIKFVQEIRGQVIAEFEREELLFYNHNPRSDLRYSGYGYSLIEQCTENISAWLFGMAYNKEVFNSSAMPKGFLSFDSESLDQEDLEELQREWTSMFTGVKGMWKTPFLQHKADWKTMAPSNRDMEWNVYIQFLSSLICAVHGIDAQEMGLRFNQAQNVLNENSESKIAFSKDRGLKDLLNFLQTVMNRIIEWVPEWEDYKFEFTGLIATDQKAELEVDKLKSETYSTINEIRQEKDLRPIEGGDIIANQYFMQNIQDQGEEGQEGVAVDVGGANSEESDDDFNIDDVDEEQIDQATKELGKSSQDEDIIIFDIA